MKLRGITIDFDDRRTCGLLPDLCLEWDEKYDELEDNQKLIDYWENNIKKVVSKTKNIVSGNIGSKAIVYSANEEAIAIIKDIFSDLSLSEIEYEDITKCERCLQYDYLDENFVPPSK
ncbi:hypothetical protein CP960_10450 [Malaciobacter halophilus]|uniref:Uncharacterized protein n=1 Tax=Malaciobacter halophilus TaxID=197482 RepID=A0A2N1J106_9BACT|nr:hypothetical protein [Malaciobacter halophilus]AXH09450.1 hypothetical protein AHALO_1069 [Malaciobacter halophilus]PKI80239.1 hypothetical protein CP960_10450 [Malaciobacter halophilus]